MPGFVASFSKDFSFTFDHPRGGVCSRRGRRARGPLMKTGSFDEDGSFDEEGVL